MGLRLTRSVDSVLYGGTALDPNKPEETFEHKIWVRRVRDHKGNQDCLLNIYTPDGCVEQLMAIGDEPLRIDPRVAISLVGIQEYWHTPDDFCEICGRGDASKSRVVPQARILVEAPRNYEIIRSNARSKYKR